MMKQPEAGEGHRYIVFVARGAMTSRSRVDPPGWTTQRTPLELHDQ